jgi:hypothetical protein
MPHRCVAIIHGRSQKLMYDLRIFSLHKVRLISTPGVKSLQIRIAGPSVSCRP